MTTALNINENNIKKTFKKIVQLGKNCYILRECDLALIFSPSCFSKPVWHFVEESKSCRVGMTWWFKEWQYFHIGVKYTFKTQLISWIKGTVHWWFTPTHTVLILYDWLSSEHKRRNNVSNKNFVDYWLWLQNIHFEHFSLIKYSKWTKNH